ncbi:MAG: hypothetical protein ACK5ND_03330 [Bacteroides sp.]
MGEFRLTEEESVYAFRFLCRGGTMKGYWEADGGIVGDGWKELLEARGKSCWNFVGRVVRG